MTDMKIRKEIKLLFVFKTLVLTQKYWDWTHCTFLNIYFYLSLIYYSSLYLLIPWIFVTELRIYKTTLIKIYGQYMLFCSHEIEFYPLIPYYRIKGYYNASKKYYSNLNFPLCLSIKIRLCFVLFSSPTFV